MTAGLCVCVLLVVLCTTCSGLPYTSRPQLDNGHRPISLSSDALLKTDTHMASEPQLRHARSVTQQLAEEEGDSRANLSELLARLISRKGSVRRNSVVNSRASGLSANHRIKDRDYLGWMDFGRRSAEEYEYSS